jgi:drug/metabolite transporter (DMT)-like permease
MSSRKLGRQMIFALILVALCIVFGAVGQILMKNGMSRVGEIGGLAGLFNLKTVINIFTNPFVLGGLVLYAISSFFWLGAMSNLNVSFMYPLLSLGYILVAIMGAVILREHITLLRWLGIVVVVIGCFLIVQTKW